MQLLLLSVCISSEVDREGRDSCKRILRLAYSHHRSAFSLVSTHRHLHVTSSFPRMHRPSQHRIFSSLPTAHGIARPTGLITSIVASQRHFGEVVTLCAFLFVTFGIAGVQMFKGAFAFTSELLEPYAPIPTFWIAIWGCSHFIAAHPHVALLMMPNLPRQAALPVRR